MALGSVKWALESQVWIACVLSWFDRTDKAFLGKEWKLGIAYAVRACCGSALTSSDVTGVLESQVWIACVLPWFDRTDGAFGVKE